jgi:hypothetical protein
MVRTGHPRPVPDRRRVSSDLRGAHGPSRPLPPPTRPPQCRRVLRRGRESGSRGPTGEGCGHGGRVYNLLKAKADPLIKRAILRSRENGAWLTRCPSCMNGTELSQEEFQDNLRLRFSLPPLNLPSHCDGCGQRFSVNHALQCKKGGLVHLRHNDVADEWAGLCQQSPNPSCRIHRTIYLCRDGGKDWSGGDA